MKVVKCFFLLSELGEIACESCVVDNTEIEENEADGRGFVVSFVLLVDKLDRVGSWSVRVSPPEMAEEDILDTSFDQSPNRTTSVAVVNFGSKDSACQSH